MAIHGVESKTGKTILALDKLDQSQPDLVVATFSAAFNLPPNPPDKHRSLDEILQTNRDGSQFQMRFSVALSRHAPSNPRDCDRRFLACKELEDHLRELLACADNMLIPFRLP